MNQEKLRNIIILKDIPSNIIDEAIIILKDNNQVNKKRIEEYARSEGKLIIKEYLDSNKKNKLKSSKKKYFLFAIFILTIIILKLIISHIY